MTEPIVVALTEQADADAVALAAAEAALHDRPLTVLHRGAEDAARALLPDVTAVFQRIDGDVGEAVIRASHDAFLVVTVATGDRRAAARRVAGHAACPTMVAARRSVDASAPVMLAVDARSGVPVAGGFAFQEAAARRVELTVLYVAAEVPGGALDTVDPFAYDAIEAMEAADRQLAEALAGHSDAYPDVTVRRRTWHDPAVVRAIADQAEKAALLVVAARDHPLMSERLLGSVSSELIGASRCPLVVVPSGSAKGPSGHIPRAG